MGNHLQKEISKEERIRVHKFMDVEELQKHTSRRIGEQHYILDTLPICVNFTTNDLNANGDLYLSSYEENVWYKPHTKYPLSRYLNIGNGKCLKDPCCPYLPRVGLTKTQYEYLFMTI
jgi:hypothetical protein